MTRKSKFSQLPAVNVKDMRSVQRFLDVTRQNLNMMTGSSLDSVVTKRNQDSTNLQVKKLHRQLNAIGEQVNHGDVQRPTQPVGFVGVASLSNIMLSWDEPSYKGHAYTVILFNQADVLGDAVVIGTAQFSNFVYPVNFLSSGYYWIKHVNKANVVGPVNDTAGLYVEAEQSPTELITLLSEEIAKQSFVPNTLLSRIALIDKTQIGEHEGLVNANLAMQAANKAKSIAIEKLQIALNEAEAQAAAARTELSNRIDGAVSVNAAARAALNSKIDSVSNVASEARTVLENKITAVETTLYDAQTGVVVAQASLKGALDNLDELLSGEGGIDARLVEVKQVTDTHTLKLDALQLKQGDLLSRMAVQEQVTLESATRFTVIETKQGADGGRIASLETTTAELAESIRELGVVDGNYSARITQVETVTADHAKRINDVEVKQGDDSARITSVEEVNAQQATKQTALEAQQGADRSRIINAETVNAQQAEKLEVMETKQGEDSARIASQESTTANHAQRIADVEVKQGDDSARITNVEDVNAQQATKQTALEAQQGADRSRIINAETVNAQQAEKLEVMEAKQGEDSARIASQESTTANHAQRIADVEVKQGDDSARITSVESVNAQQASKLSTIEVVQDEHQSNIDALELADEEKAQSIKVLGFQTRPIDDTPNLLNVLDWKLDRGSAVGQNSWGQNGNAAENFRIRGVGPYGATTLWVGQSDGGNNGCGGWNVNIYNVDPAKSYRFMCWYKRTKTKDSSAGSYLGTRGGVRRLDGTIHSNPYFLAPNGNQLDSWGIKVGEWFAIVGVQFAHDHTGTENHPDAGVYNQDGQKVATASCFKFPDASWTYFTHRCYYYYETDAGQKQYFAEPRVEALDGSEVPFSDLINIKDGRLLAHSSKISLLEQADSQMAQRLALIEFDVNDENGLLKSSVANLERADSEKAERLALIEFDVNDENGLLKSSVASLEQATANNAQRINQVSIESGNAIAAAESRAKAYSDTLTGALRSEYVIKTDANGVMAGFGLISDSQTGSEIYLSADKVAFVPPGWNPQNQEQKLLPFIYSAEYGRVVMDQASIVDLTAEKVIGGNLAVDDFTVTNAFNAPAGAIKRWMIDHEFIDGLVRIDPDAEKLGGGSTVTVKYKDATRQAYTAYVKSGGAKVSVSYQFISPKVKFTQPVMLRASLWIAKWDDEKQTREWQKQCRINEDGTLQTIETPTVSDVIVMTSKHEGGRYYFSEGGEYVWLNAVEGNSYRISIQIESVTALNGSDIKAAFEPVFGEMQWGCSYDEAVKSSGGVIADIHWKNVIGAPLLAEKNKANEFSAKQIFSKGIQVTSTEPWHKFNTPHGYIHFGPANGSHAHIYTGSPNFYFNKQLLVLGHTVYNTGNDSNLVKKDATNVLSETLTVNNQVRIGSTKTIGLDVTKISSNAALAIFNNDMTLGFDGNEMIADVNGEFHFKVGNKARFHVPIQSDSSLSVGGVLSTFDNVIIGHNTNKRLLTRHIDGKGSSTNNDDHLYLNHTNGKNVYINNHIAYHQGNDSNLALLNRTNTFSGNVNLHGLTTISTGNSEANALTIKRYTSSLASNNDDVLRVWLEDSNVKFLLNNDSDSDGSHFVFATKVDGNHKTILDFNHVGHFKYDGKRVWHEGNDGVGSGLDADMFQGHSPQRFVHYQSGRDFTHGTLVRTDINYAGRHGDPWYLEIQSNNYGNAHIPSYTQIQGYIYNDTIINYSGIHHGQQILGIVAFEYEGQLCFWWPSQGYWKGYDVLVRRVMGGQWTNRVYSIQNVSKPTAITKEINLSSKIVESWHAANDGTGSGLDADLVQGRQSAQSGNNVNLITASNGYLNLNNWLGMISGRGVFWTGSGAGSHLYQQPDGYMYLTQNSSGKGLSVEHAIHVDLDGTKHKVFHKGFMGAGSGLDADMLDGQDSLHYLSGVSQEYKTITVGGDADTFYPVQIHYFSNTGYSSHYLTISRVYNWTAPDTWATATHRGGLDLGLTWSGDSAWGGNNKQITVYKFYENYSRMVGGMHLGTDGLVVWLRGGGATYRVIGPRGLAQPVTVHLAQFTARNGHVYPLRNLSEAEAGRNSEVFTKQVIRGNADLYDQGKRVYSDNNKPTLSQLEVLDDTHVWSGGNTFNQRTNLNGSVYVDGHVLLNGTDTWLRTRNSDGIFFSTHGGGLHMTDSNWIRTYNAKKFLSQNTGSDAIRSLGGIVADTQVTAKDGGFLDLDPSGEGGMVGNYTDRGTAPKIIWTIGTNWRTHANHYGIGYAYGKVNTSGNSHTITYKDNGNIGAKINLVGDAWFARTLNAPVLMENSINIADKYLSVNSLSYDTPAAWATAWKATDEFRQWLSSGDADTSGYDTVTPSIATGFINSVIGHFNTVIASKANIGFLNANAIEVTGRRALINNFSASENYDGWTCVADNVYGAGNSLNNYENLNFIDSLIAGETTRGRAITVVNNKSTSFRSNKFVIDHNAIYEFSFSYYRPTTKTAGGTNVGHTYLGVLGYKSNGTTLGSFERYSINNRTHEGDSTNQYFNNSTNKGNWVHWTGYLVGANRSIDEVPETNCKVLKAKLDVRTVYLRFLNWSNGGQLTVANPSVREIKTGKIVAYNIVADAIQTQHLQADSVNASKIAAAAIQAEHISAGVINSTHIASKTIKAENIAAGAITATEIAAKTITAALIAAASITATEIAADTITAGQIAANAITVNELAANAVTAVKIVSDAIETRHITADAVTAVEIAAGAIQAEHITAGIVTSNHIASRTIVAEDIKAETITATEIAVNSITASRMRISNSDNVWSDFDMTDIGLWNYTAGKFTLVGTGVSTMGKQRARLAGRAGGTCVAHTHWLEVKEGAEYRIETTAFLESATGTSVVEVQTATLNAAGDATYTENIRIGSVTSSAQSNVVAKSIKIAAGIRRIRLVFTRPATSDSGYFTFGAIRIVRKFDGQLIVDGSIDAHHIVANSLEAHHIQAGAIEAQHIVSDAIETRHLKANTIQAEHIDTDSLQTRHFGADVIESSHIKVSAKDLINNFSKSGDMTGWSRSSGLEAVSYGISTVQALKVETSGNVQVYSPWTHVDHDEIYKVSITIFSRHGDATGTRYLGIHTDGDGVGTNVERWHWTNTTDRTLSTISDSNPYFWHGDVWNNQWKVVTGYVVGANRSVNEVPAKKEGELGNFIYRMKHGTKRLRMRFLNYYNNGTTVTNWFYNPSITAAGGGLITTPNLVAGAITADKIKALAINAGHIQAGVIDTQHLAAGAITTDKLEAGSITADKIAANAITTSKLVAGSITADKVNVASLRTAILTANSINSTHINTASLDVADMTWGNNSLSAISANDGVSAYVSNLYLQTPTLNGSGSKICLYIDPKHASSEAIRIKADSITGSQGIVAYTKGRTAYLNSNNDNALYVYGGASGGLYAAHIKARSGAAGALLVEGDADFRSHTWQAMTTNSSHRVRTHVSDNASSEHFINFVGRDIAAGQYRSTGIGLYDGDSYVYLAAKSNKLEVRNPLEVKSSGGFSGDLWAHSGIHLKSSEALVMYSGNGSKQRMDSRDTGTEGRIHWYGVNSSGATRRARFALYDGANYNNIDANANYLTFSRGIQAAYARFSGEVTFFYSDKRLKTIESHLDKSKALADVMRWSTVRYKGNKLAKQLGQDAESTQLGLIVQDIEGDYPELIAPAACDIDGETQRSKTGLELKTLKYERTITVLTAALQASVMEQQKTRRELSSLKELLIKKGVI